MPNLQLHQVRVAAVAKLVCDRFTKPIGTNDVVLECLFHDMGNIVKFGLAYFPEFVQPEGLEYWESVQADFIKRYSSEQHAVNAAIAHEIGLSAEIIDIMNASGFSRVGNILETGSIELKVCQYADLRVGPHAIVSLEERLTDFSRRYAGKGGSVHADVLPLCRELERQIFANASIKPEEINDASAVPIIEKLWEYPVA